MLTTKIVYQIAQGSSWKRKVSFTKGKLDRRMTLTCSCEEYFTAKTSVIYTASVRAKSVEPSVGLISTPGSHVSSLFYILVMKLININFHLRYFLPKCQPRNTTLLSEEIQNVPFIVSLSTAASSHRKPAFASTPRCSCRVLGHCKKHRSHHVTEIP